MPAGWLPLAGVGIGGSYTGLGDLVSGAKAFWGMRGYNGAFSGNVATICDVATGLTCANATWSGGVLTVPTIGGSACNVVACNVSELFDQTGNGNHLVQATNANRPVITLNCLGSKPCVVFVATNSQVLSTAATMGTFTQPNSTAGVAMRTGAFTSYGSWFGDGSGQNSYLFANGTNRLVFFAGSGTPSCNTGSNPADSAWHSFQFIANGASSVCNYDNSSNALGGGPGSSAISGTGNIGHDGLGSDYLTADIMEVGVWNTGFNSTLQTSVCHNQYLYYGTSVSC